MFLTDASTAASGLGGLTSTATDVLTWLLSAATKVYEFMIANPLCLLYIGISLAFIAIAVIRRVLHAR